MFDLVIWDEKYCLIVGINLRLLLIGLIQFLLQYLQKDICQECSQFWSHSLGSSCYCIDCTAVVKQLLIICSYYPALKTLEQLEHTYLPRVSKYRFAQTMCATIPKMRDSIKNASMSDLKDFLESILKHSARIGEIAMKQVNSCLQFMF